MKDLLLIDQVDEEHVAQELITSYRKGQVYTFLGPVLIAINPYKDLTHRDRTSIYSVQSMDEFQGKEMHLSEPHPFAIAEAAYSNLMRFGNDQSLLVTGESGSGKTETSKHVMQYLTTISSRGRARKATIANRRMSVVQRQEVDTLIKHVTDVLWGSNPVLESFGNAQTIRNFNSSRFGKYIVLQLNRLGQVVGGYIDNYLLERHRVIYQAEGERNFHSFYQLLAGATKEEKEAWGLLNASEYNYLVEGLVEIEGVNDAKEYQHVRKNMDMIGISKDEQHVIFQQLSAVLWLGNITFIETTDEAHNKIAVIEKEGSARDALNWSAKLIGIEPRSLEDMLTFRLVKIYNEDQTVLFDKRQARKVADSIARSIYEKVFNWIVARINKNVKCLKPREIANSIGILDIYGFEIFDVNAFEQLCINYVNEKLQQLFISQTLEAEQEEYRREGMTWWASVAFENNSRVCELIEDPKIHGIFPLLDEQCAIARLSELELIERYNSSHTNHPNFIRSRIQGPHFTIQHYAGKVEYDVTLFFEANVDTMFNNVLAGVMESTIPFVKEIFVDTRTSEESKKRPPSTSQQFRTQVQSLIKNLDNCNPQYIRCIKPNNMKSPLVAQEDLVVEQVHYLGLVENLNVRRQGFCYKTTYKDFVDRYRFLSTETWPKVKAFSTRKATVDLLTSDINQVYVDSAKNQRVAFVEDDTSSLGCFALGRTKVFLKYPQALATLEQLREAKIPEIVGILENAWRRYKNRIALVKFTAAYNELRQAYDEIVVNIQLRQKRNPQAKVDAPQLYANWEVVSSKLQKNDNRLSKSLQAMEDNRSITFAQSFVKRNAARRNFLKLRNAQMVFSKRYRGLKTRKQLTMQLWASCKTALLGVRTEFERYLGEKKRRRDSLDRQYKGDYIGISQYPAYQTILNSIGRPQKVLFAAQVMKVNERFVHQERILLVGENKLYNLKASHIQAPKERRSLELHKITGIVMSTLPDNYIVIQVQSEFDMLMVVDQKTELVTLLRKQFRKAYQKDLPVKFSDKIEFMALVGKKLSVHFTFDRTVKAKEGQWTKVDRKTMAVAIGIV